MVCKVLSELRRKKRETEMLKKEIMLTISVTKYFNSYGDKMEIVDLDQTEIGEKYFKELTKDQKIVLKHQLITIITDFFKRKDLQGKI